jgi:hypothetical protein
MPTQKLIRLVSWYERHATEARFHFVIFHYHQHQYGDSTNCWGESESGVKEGPTTTGQNTVTNTISSPPSPAVQPFPNHFTDWVSHPIQQAN